MVLFFFSTLEFMQQLPVQMSEHIAIQTQYEFQAFNNMALGFSQNKFLSKQFFSSYGIM